MAMTAKEEQEWQLADIPSALEILIKLLVQKQHIQMAAVIWLRGLCLGVWCLYEFFRLHVLTSLLQ